MSTAWTVCTYLFFFSLIIGPSIALGAMLAPNLKKDRERELEAELAKLKDYGPTRADTYAQVVGGWRRNAIVWTSSPKLAIDNSLSIAQWHDCARAHLEEANRLDAELAKLEADDKRTARHEAQLAAIAENAAAETERVDFKAVLDKAFNNFIFDSTGRLQVACPCSKPEESELAPGGGGGASGGGALIFKADKLDGGFTARTEVSKVEPVSYTGHIETTTEFKPSLPFKAEDVISQAQFKVGDLVRVTGWGGGWDGSEGEVYQEQTEDGSVLIRTTANCKYGIGSSACFPTRFLKLVSPRPFKVGDKVKLKPMPEGGFGRNGKDMGWFSTTTYKDFDLSKTYTVDKIQPHAESGASYDICEDHIYLVEFDGFPFPYVGPSCLEHA